MQDAALLGSFEADGHTMVEAARRAGLDTKVPGCPDWTVGDLVRHTASVFEHKIEVIRTGKRPEEWTNESSDRLDWLADAHARMFAALVSRPAEHELWTWYPPRQDVRFWIRRMAQEVLVHRIDAEQAAGIGPDIDAELAADGVDEALECFIVFDLEGEAEVAGNGERIRIVSTDTSHTWSLELLPKSIGFSRSAAESADVTVTAPAADLLLWIWGRGSLQSAAVTGDAALAARLIALSKTATQ